MHRAKQCHRCTCQPLAAENRQAVRAAVIAHRARRRLLLEGGVADMPIAASHAASCPKTTAPVQCVVKKPVLTLASATPTSLTVEPSPKCSTALPLPSCVAAATAPLGVSSELSE